MNRLIRCGIYITAIICAAVLPGGISIARVVVCFLCGYGSAALAHRVAP